MKNYIESHLTQSIIMEDLAWVSGLNVVYCGALFKQETGMSALRYWRTLQIRKAAQLLSEPDISVSEAAWQAGFDDLFYFSKLFKEIQGLSPKAYQRRHARSAFFAIRKDPPLPFWIRKSCGSFLVHERLKTMTYCFTYAAADSPATFPVTAACALASPQT